MTDKKTTLEIQHLSSEDILDMAHSFAEDLNFEIGVDDLREFAEKVLLLARKELEALLEESRE